MLGSEDFIVIQALVQRGVYLCDIAQQLGVHPKTVRRALQRGGPPRQRGGRRGSVLDPYRLVVDQLLAEGVWNAVVIWRELQAKGYAGGISILRDYLRPKRELRSSRATVRFETEPGRQRQSDWATQRTVIAGEATAVHFIVNTLSFSRRFHFWCTETEDAEHTYDGLIRAFKWFGGAPAEVLVDSPPDVEAAEGHFRHAVTLAHQLGMRPLIAHCHLDLGALYHRIGDHAKANEYRTIATTMYREMDMAFWLAQVEAERAEFR